MLEEHFLPDFPPAVCAEINALPASPPPPAGCRDLRGLLWSSIDNTDSRDLDQIEWAEKLPDGRIRVLVAIANVGGTVRAGSAIDAQARANATSVYAAGPVFPMLPEKLSTDLTSLGQHADRTAVLIEFVVDESGGVVCADVSPVAVRNRARLNYTQVGRWLQGAAAAPADGVVPAGLTEQLRLQAEAATRLQKFRKEQGALALDADEPNPASEIIESFMIAANVAMSKFLRDRSFLCLARVVRTPKRWDRIQAIAAQFGTKLPAEPDSRALSDFLASRRQADPERFPEVSLGVLKSLGPGEYMVQRPGTESVGHFGLAVEDYTHSTAPNRRYADLIMQRLVTACLGQAAAPFSEEELTGLALHCTERESAARHVERLMQKVAAALALGPRVGQTFDAIVTGVSPKGVFARLLAVAAEGRIMRGERGLDVGEKIRARLAGVDVNKGFIDLEAVG